MARVRLTAEEQEVLKRLQRPLRRRGVCVGLEDVRIRGLIRSFIEARRLVAALERDGWMHGFRDLRGHGTVALSPDLFALQDKNLDVLAWLWTLDLTVHDLPPGHNFTVLPPRRPRRFDAVLNRRNPE